jgi:hypothetical protein
VAGANSYLGLYVQRDTFICVLTSNLIENAILNKFTLELCLCAVIFYKALFRLGLLSEEPNVLEQGLGLAQNLLWAVKGSHLPKLVRSAACAWEGGGV